MLVIRYRALCCALATSVSLLAPAALAAPAGAEAPGPKDAQAEKALKKALEEDFLETRFDDAVQRLKAAVKTCGAEGCSRRVLARLHAALGSVLAGGKRELEDGRDAFIDALMLDPTIKPDPEISSAAVTFSFEQAQQRLKAINQAEKNSAAPGAGKAPPPRRPPPPPPKPKPPHARENWLSLTFIPDFTLLSGTDVCTKTVRTTQYYTCLHKDKSGQPSTAYTGNPTVGDGFGDNINLGLGASTVRVMVGYERLFLKSLTVGLRLGMAFNGSPSSSVPFNPFHGEVRVSYFPRPSSFLGTVLRPYVGVAGGFEQVNTRVDVEVLEDGEKCGAMPASDLTAPCPNGEGVGPNGRGRQQTLAAYKRAGYGFATLGGGLQIAPVDNFSINIGVRGGITFATLVGVISPEIGVSLGF